MHIGRQQPRASSPLGSFCAASKALLETVDSGKRTYDELHVEAIVSLLEDLQPAAAALDDVGRAALFVALLHSISAAFRWPTPRTEDEFRAEKSAKKLCAAATNCARDLFNFDLNGAFLQSPQHRDDAIRLVSALLTGNALHSFAQRLSEASSAALDELELYQRSQQELQPRQEDRPVGQEQRQGRAAAGTGAQGSRRKPAQGAAASSTSDQDLPCPVLARVRVEQWLPILDDLGTLIHITARHDPYAPTSEHQPSISSLGLGAPPPVGPLDRGRPPPVYALYASAIASSGVLEHAARAMATVALLSGTVQQQGLNQHAGGGGGAGGWDDSTHSSWAIEACASLMQLVGLAPEPAKEAPSTSGSGSNGGGNSGKACPRAAGLCPGPSPAPHGSTRPVGRQPHPQTRFGPWYRYVLTCLGLRCLHGLDGGSCYGMPRELVRGLPTMVAPGTLTYDTTTNGLRRTAMTPLQRTVSCIQMLGTMVRQLEPVGRTIHAYGTWERGTKVHAGGSASGLTPLPGDGRAMGKGPLAGSGSFASQAGAGEGRWPVVGPKAARDISRRVVGWAVGLARGWVAEEERRRRAGGGGGGGRGGGGGGGGRGGGYDAMAVLGLLGTGFQEDGDEAGALSLARCTVGPLTVQALRVYRSALEEAGAGAGAGMAAAGGAEGGACGRGGQGRRRQGRQEEGREQEQQQQQRALLAEWYGLACGAVQYAMCWPTEDDAGHDLAQLMVLGLPLLTHTGAALACSRFPQLL